MRRTRAVSALVSMTIAGIEASTRSSRAPTPALIDDDALLQPPYWILAPAFVWLFRVNPRAPTARADPLSRL